MRTISEFEASAEFPKLLQEVEAGEEVVIARDNKPIARLVRVKSEIGRRRPQVGELRGEPFRIPAAAFAPLTDAELKEWGL